MKNRFHVFMLAVFLFSQTANTASSSELDQFNEIAKSSIVTLFILPVLITVSVHYVIAPSTDRPRSAGEIIAAETIKTLFTAVIARTVWAPITSIFNDFYDTDAKTRSIRKEKEQKQEAVLSNLDRLLPQIRKYLQGNNTKAAIDLMVNMVLRVRHLHADLDVYSDLIIKDTIEAMLLNRTSIPCDFYEHVMDNLEKKDIRVRGNNMTYYRDFLENWNIPNVPCLDIKNETYLEENCPNIYPGLIKKWETQKESYFVEKK